uniref:Uncharacterized protein n=1 Tax=Guillardia theta TaxID=55529 RepID=A0A7S4K8I6_GUITH|mmetsp:Transcript_21919/g.72406  ORF Transcript_21919/g.72406 Transcript_21919/m.72406 type:complete len:869 (+) Transcript_21919:61-2667(+)
MGEIVLPITSPLHLTSAQDISELNIHLRYSQLVKAYESLQHEKQEAEKKYEYQLSAMRQLLKRRDSSDLKAGLAPRQATNAKEEGDEKRLVQELRRRLVEQQNKMESLQGDLLLAVDQGIKYRESLRRMVEFQETREKEEVLESERGENKRLMSRNLQLNSELMRLSRANDEQQEHMEQQQQDIAGLRLLLAGTREQLEEQLKEARDLTVTLADVMAQLDQDKFDATSAREKTRKMVDQVTQSCSAMIGELRMSVLECVGMRTRLEAAHESERTPAQLDRQQEQIQAATNFLRTLEGDIYSICELVKESKPDVSWFEREWRRVSEETEELEGRKEESRQLMAACSDKTQTIADLQAELGEVRSSLDRKLTAMAATNEKLEAERAEKEKQLEHARRELEKVRDEASWRLQQRQKEAEVLTREREELEQKLRAKSVECEAMKMKAKEAEEAKAKVMDDLHKLRSEQARGRDEEVEKLLEIARCKSEVSEKLERELAEEAEKREELAQALREAQEETSHVRLQRLRDEEEGRRERRRLEREKELLTNAREEWTKREERWRNELDMLLRSNEELRVQVETFNSQAAKAKEEEREKEEREKEEREKEEREKTQQNSEKSQSDALQTPARPTRLSKIDDELPGMDGTFLPDTPELDQREWEEAIAQLEAASPNSLKDVILVNKRASTVNVIAIDNILRRQEESVTRVDLSYNYLRNSGVISLAYVFKLLSSLVHLDLGDNHVGDSGACALADALSTASSLQTLALGGNRIADLGAAAMAAQLPATLVTLNLNFNFVADEGAAALARALPSASSLSCIYLSGNSIGGGGAARMAEAMASARQLKQLYLRGNPIDEEGKGALERAAQLHPSLVIFV